MDKKLKKLIAREFLVIISVTLASAAIAALTYGYGLILTNKIERLEEKYNIEHEYRPQEKEYAVHVNGKKDISKYTQDELRAFTEMNHYLKRTEWLEETRGLLLLSPFMVYFLYLFITCVVWAIQTLKEE